MLVPEPLRARHRQHLDAFANGAQVARRMGELGAPVEGRRKNGETFPADATISKLDVGGMRTLTVALRDITEQRTIEREQRFLAEVGPLLAGSLEYEKTLAQIADLAVREIADLCIVEVVETDETVRRVRVASRDPAKAWLCDLLTRTPLDRRRPHLMQSVLETRETLLLQPTAEMIDSFAQSEEHLRALRAAEIRSLLAVALVANGRLLGAMGFVSSAAARVYGLADVRLAEELARRAALSIENARLYSDAQRATRARDEVLAIVAHDLRNPLNAILLQTALLRSGGPNLERRAHEKANAIERSATRMNRLIQDLLDVTRMESGHLSIEPTRVPARKIVTDAVEAQQPIALSRSLELRIDAASELPDVWGDRDRLGQVFENLIGNALKFTAPGGFITIGAAPKGADVLFWVKDTGAGIAGEDLPHLFDRFWQARRADRRGAGLGLAIAKGVIEAHGGRIWVESAPGRGSTFYFCIPTEPGGAELRATSSTTTQVASD